MGPMVFRVLGREVEATARRRLGDLGHSLGQLRPQSRINASMTTLRARGRVHLDPVRGPRTTAAWRLRSGLAGVASAPLSAMRLIDRNRAYVRRRSQCAR